MTARSSFVLALSLAACTSSSPSTPDGSCTSSDYLWAISGGGPGQGDGVTGTALAADGSVWVTGTFIGSTTWGTFQLTAADTVHPSIFVAKLDPTGKVVLARAIQAGTGGTTNIDNEPTRIRLDRAGNPIIVGTFQDELDVDSIKLVENDNGNGAAFVLGLDGTTGAARFGGASSGDTDGVAANDVAIDSAGDLYVTGGYNGNVTFDAITVAGTSSDQAVFVAKYSPSTQAWVWAKGWAGEMDGTNDGGIGRGIAVSSDGHVYATGNIAGTLKVDTTVLTGDGGSFVVKLATADGSVESTGQITPSAPGDRDWSSAAVTDRAGALYVTGKFSSTATFGTQQVTSIGGGDNMFLAKYDPSGVLVWVQNAGVADGTITRGDDVAYDGQDLYVGGFTQGDTMFGAITLPVSSTLFVAKYDTSGKPIWAQNATIQPNSSSSAETAALAVTSPTSGVVLGGSYDTTTTFGDTELTGPGNGDAFVAELCN